MLGASKNSHRETTLALPLSFEAISSQGVKRAQGHDGWYEAAPSLDALTNKGHLYLEQRVASIAPRRAESVQAEEAPKLSNTANDPKFRSGHIYNQRPGRPVTALPVVWDDGNPWSTTNGAIERSRFSNRLPVLDQPTDYDLPEEKITRYTKKYHHKLFPSRTSKRAPVWFTPVKNSDRHIFEKLSDDNPPEWFVDGDTENPFPARSAARAGGIKNPPVGPNGGKQWSVTSLAAPNFMQITGEPRRRQLPEGERRARPATRSGRVGGSRPTTAA